MERVADAMSLHASLCAASGNPTIRSIDSARAGIAAASSTFTKFMAGILSQRPQFAGACSPCERTEAEAQVAGERSEIVRVREELLDMFADPEKRKRYFSVVDMAELEENEFNLNLPRYVDTFEPEEEIDLKKAINDLNKTISDEKVLENKLQDLLTGIRGN